MSSATDLHNKAMNLAEEAFNAKANGHHSKSKTFARQAFELERKAALTLLNKPNAEPSRSVLLRSAASLALECDDNREAEKLVATALAGDPPNEIADELRDLLEQVNFARHLELRGLKLHSDEVQLSLTGKLVGFGSAHSTEFLNRAHATEKLLTRTGERLSDLPFRESGRDRLDDLEVFFSAPRAASFAISVRVGTPQRQGTLPGFVGPTEVIDDLVECLSCFSEGDRNGLHERIKTESYFNNFVGLARKLAPDGNRIKTVGITVVRGGKNRQLALSHPPLEIWQPTKKTKNARTVRLVGLLKAADETGTDNKHFLSVVTNKSAVKVFVPPGILQDIVKPLWGEKVVVIADLKNDIYHYVSIDAAATAESEASEPS